MLAPQVTIPARVVAACQHSPGSKEWLIKLPALIRDLRQRWNLTLEPPFDNPGVGCSWAAPATLANGRRAVLKAGLPHMESAHEIDGLRFWNGNGTVEIIDCDGASGAMLLERCEPGRSLRALPEPEQDVVIGALLRRLWRAPEPSHPFRHLSLMTEAWSREAISNQDGWLDAGLVRAGLQLFYELPRNAPCEVLLVTDLHAGNVLQAQREPWLVIDPKPFVGDSAYDATQHLFNCEARLRADPFGTIARFADYLEVSGERVRLWMFARAAIENATTTTELARLLAA